MGIYRGCGLVLPVLVAGRPVMWTWLLQFLGIRPGVSRIAPLWTDDDYLPRPCRSCPCTCHISEREKCPLVTADREKQAMERQNRR
jgi:hypothetical protein